MARQSFIVVRRGFDQAQVTAFLAKVADELREARDREAALRTELASVESGSRPTIELDEATLMAALGEETARVLIAAREAAAEIRAKGEESVGRLLREATDEANRLRVEAEAALSTKTAEAERQAAAIREEAETIVGDLLAEAESKEAEAKLQRRAPRRSEEVRRTPQMAVARPRPAPPGLTKRRPRC